ncbi:MAG: MFS transporter, partial [Pigmentiphaga sp.]|nr:MFS transporter [Pigmentiphaga sp.]
MQQALNEGVRRRELFAWAFYDFANSGYTTVVLTAVFNAYFVSVVTGNQVWSTLAWTTALSCCYLLVMLTMPRLGSWADRHGSKKAVLLVSTLACVGATIALGFAGPGSIALAVVALVISNYAFSVGESMIAAFLPELARPEALGKVSGWGWGIGYLGGMLTLGLSLAVVLHYQALGEPATRYVPLTLWITALIYVVAALPTFLLLKERSVRAPAEAPRAHPTRGKQWAQWKRLAVFPDFRRLLVCGVLYQAGIAVVITLAAIYAEQVMQFSQSSIMALIFMVNIAAALGAVLLGFLEDRIGHQRTLALTLLGWIVMVLLASSSQHANMFWAAAVLAGLCMGSSQSIGRAMTAAFAPAAQRAEFFGLWTTATRLAFILGPMCYGLVTWVTAGNHRTAMLLTGGFFVAGLAVLASIQFERGRARV